MVDLRQLFLTKGVPCRIALAGSSVLECVEIVRRIPDRRLVCRGVWNNQPVYAKIFLGDKARRYAERDASGVRALLAANIQTPALLYAGKLLDVPGEVLVFAEVSEGRSAEVVWQSLNDPAARLELMMKLVEAVAAHHRAGLIQHDMYLKNFLVSEIGIFTLDGDGIRRHAAPVSRREGLGNLALLLSKFDATDDDWLPQLLQHYAAMLGVELLESEMRAFPAQVMAHRLRVARGYADLKVFRPCTDVAIEHGWRSFKAIERSRDSQELRALLDNPEARLRHADARILKNGNTCTVFALPLDDLKVVVKRYNIKSFRHALGRAWRPSRAAASWANAHRMRMLGITTAEPLALLERRWGLLRRQAYYVAEHVDAPDAPAYFANPEIVLQHKQHAAENIARLLHKLWRLELVHGDMKASNVLIDKDDQPVLLDLDAMREVRCRRMLRRGHARDLLRWMMNWHNVPEMDKLMRAALRQAYQDDALLHSLGVDVKKSENT